MGPLTLSPNDLWQARGAAAELRAGVWAGREGKVQAVGERTVWVGVVGTGSGAQVNIPAFHSEGVKVVAGWSRPQERASEVGLRSVTVRASSARCTVRRTGMGSYHQR